ncbi:hypothetical protein HanRHA438_Chr14g0661021 [Helianthus annuus]|uniref:Uncharacterized protein n=1 Tax=Helianthus annuus TaxID=4232 RepID=A0A251SIM3_HELAN|nr:hypothetical protein HanXRQr2_Chr14g0650331 [Helianthus annuus]KAJ0464593.1 hypothetical protein HanHA300_Chr14g0529081 [Helianthus annuus]KAJ0469204.1 hypothetical protein HanIR_Chr14g0705351 [Helianthus annuus]KAJ0469205.1 hypothetical protein HanIR_Chr14g0705371 [Helianthus annuus]KAJ0486191.1 hypothetical protein HanHA89_Chr14g0576961 [Helianthus annuus]
MLALAFCCSYDVKIHYTSSYNHFTSNTHNSRSAATIQGINSIAITIHFPGSIYPKNV